MVARTKIQNVEPYDTQRHQRSLLVMAWYTFANVFICLLNDSPHTCDA
jgi:hypothetical protein